MNTCPEFSPGSKVIVSHNSDNEDITSVTPYRGKVFVLVDGETKSSGEWATLYFKRLPNCTVIGSPTYGMIHFGNSGYLKLPSSGLEVTLCMKINRLTSGEFYEKSGIVPDIFIENQDSYKYVLDKLD